MKKRKFVRKLLAIASVIIFLIAFLETILYYRHLISNQFYLFMLSVMNGIFIFGLRSTIDIVELFQTGADSFGLVGTVLSHLYIICYFCAPLITVRCISLLLSFIVKEKIINLSAYSRKERILIVGYNEYVDKLAKQVIELNQDKKRKEKKKLLILHKNDIPEKKKFKFQKAGVLFMDYEKLDYGNDDDTKLLLKWLVPKRVKNIILLEKKEMDNVSNYLFFLSCFEVEGHSGFVSSEEQKIEIDCNYDLPQVEQLIWSCYDNKNVGFEYQMNTFSIPMLRAQAILDEHKIYENVMDADGECKDIHLLIIGFGRMGRRLFKRAINYSVVSEKNNIFVDIVEKDVEKTKWHFEKYCNEFYNKEENIVHIDSGVAEGNLQIRLHGFDIRDVSFQDCLKQTSKTNPFTYIAICIDNPKESVNCFLRVEKFLQEQEQDVPILMRLDSGQQLKELNNIYSNLHLVPSDDEIISMSNITNERLKDIANNIYEDDGPVCSEEMTKYAYEIESGKYRELHFDVKKELVARLKNSKRGYNFDIFGTSVYTDKQKREEFVDMISEDELLFKLGAIEHRRWCYYMILTGWTFGEEKDEKRKKTPYLRPFKEILEDNNLKQKAYCEYADWSDLLN